MLIWFPSDLAHARGQKHLPAAKQATY